MPVFPAEESPVLPSVLPSGPSVPRYGRRNDGTYKETRAYLDHTYSRFGMAGIMRLLPRRAAAQLERRRRRRRGGGVWDALCDVLSNPETTLFLLLVAFVLLVMWDSGQADAGMMPPLTALHMSPFPLTSA